MMCDWIVFVRLENGAEDTVPRRFQDIAPEYIEEYMRKEGWDVIRAVKLEA